MLDATPASLSEAGDRQTAVLQLTHGGHRLRYVRLLAEGTAVRAPAVTLITTIETRQSPDFIEHLDPLYRTGRLRVRTVGSLNESTQALVERGLNPLTPEDIIVVPDSDKLVGPLLRYALRRRRRRKGLPALRFLLMRTPELRLPTDREALAGMAKCLVVLALREGWADSRALFLTDPWGIIAYRRGYHAAPVRDPSPGLPVVSRDLARAEFGFGPDQFVLGLLGGAHPRKHASLTLDAMQDLPGDVSVLVAGQQTAAARERLALQHDDPARLVVRDAYLSDAELARCVAACDALVLAYDLDAPSGLLVAAHDAGVAVIAAGSPWVCRVVAELDLGVVEELSTEGVVRGVGSLRATRLEPRRGPRLEPSGAARATGAATAVAFTAAFTGD